MRKREYEREENGQNVVIKWSLSGKKMIHMKKKNVIEMEEGERDVETKALEDYL
jgi:hypothetical protein